MEFENLLFLLEGRCDGLLFSGEYNITIEEIKSTSLPLESMDERTNPAHWAQAQCYGFMFLKEQGKDQRDLRLTYVHKISGDKKFFTRTSSLVELEDSVRGMIANFAPYARLQVEHGLKRDLSIKKLNFPFPRYRQGQRQLAGAVYKTINEGRTLFANAPTGIGKTISTIFPAVKAIREERIRKLFYLTAKTTTRQTAEEAFSLMIKKGLEIRTVTITAKAKVCFTSEGKCNKNDCEYANGYYDRINDAVLDILRKEAILDRSCIEKYARKHLVCPFEFSLDLAYAADAVICDYNYIFDPKVSLKKLFDEQKRKTILLVDEAHNLVDRGRDIFSATLEKSPFLQLKREFKEKNHSLGDISKRLNNYFIQLRKQVGSSKTMEFEEPLEELNQLVAEFIEHAENELIRAGELDLLLETFFVAQNWQRITRLYDERHFIC